jgi:uncharacterized protein YgiM (DUF1202 family)
MPYVNCPNCGQKALTVATRCPQCGLAFENQFSQAQELVAKQPRSKRGLFIAAAVVAIVLMEAVLRGPGAPPPSRLPTTAVAPNPPPAPVVTARPPEVPVDTVRAAPPPPPAETKVEAAPPATVSAVPAAPAHTAEPAAAPATGAIVRPGTRRLYANIWVNVRSERSNSSNVIQILRPGQAVVVDTLIQGWYRIVAEHDAVGYVDKHYLQESPPPDAP